MGSGKDISTALIGALWPPDYATLPRWRRLLLHPPQILYAIGRDLARGELSLRAMSLVYTTLLSLVPLLAVSFSVLKGFGVHNQLEPMLLQALAPLGPQAGEIAQQLIGYVDRTDVRVLGSLGLALLLYSVISLISKIEQVFNYTWRVDHRRPLGQRFTQYLSVLLIGPVLFFSALGATASLSSNWLWQRALAIEPVGFVVDSAERLVPLLLITLAFTFVYMFVPNTRVRLRSALMGALIAGVLWQAVGQAFATFMAGSTRYAAIYSSLAIPILFMIWVYIAWLILLVGASIAFYDQFPEYLPTGAKGLRLSNRLRERTALLVAARIAEAHYGGMPAWSAEALAHRLELPLTNVRNVLRLLQEADVAVATADSPSRYVPARAPEEIRLTELLRSIRSFGEDPRLAGQPSAAAGVDAVEQRLDEATEAALADWTLRDLARRCSAPNTAGAQGQPIDAAAVARTGSERRSSATVESGSG